MSLGERASSRDTDERADHSDGDRPQVCASAEDEASLVSRKGWSRDQVIALIALILSAPACLATVLVVPEVRQALGLAPSVESIATSGVATAPDARASGEPGRTHPVLEYFPLYVGTSWIYSYAEQEEGYDDDGSTIGVETEVVTESVAMVTTSIADEVYMARVVVSGSSIPADCHETSSHGTGSEYWIVADKRRAFIACSKREANSLASDLVHGPDATPARSGPPTLPEFVFPLEEGLVWQAFTDIPADDENPSYQWHVESELDVRVPAGTFTDCYRIQLFTLPDTTKRWICPGVGVVAAEYNHHGSVHDYRAELISYEVAVGR